MPITKDSSDNSIKINHSNNNNTTVLKLPVDFLNRGFWENNENNKFEINAQSDDKKSIFIEYKYPAIIDPRLLIFKELIKNGIFTYNKIIVSGWLIDFLELSRNITNFAKKTNLDDLFDDHLQTGQNNQNLWREFNDLYEQIDIILSLDLDYDRLSESFMVITPKIRLSNSVNISIENKGEVLIGVATSLYLKFFPILQKEIIAWYNPEANPDYNNWINKSNIEIVNELYRQIITIENLFGNKVIDLNHLRRVKSAIMNIANSPRTHSDGRAYYLQLYLEQELDSQYDTKNEIEAYFKNQSSKIRLTDIKGYSIINNDCIKDFDCKIEPDMRVKFDLTNNTLLIENKNQTQDYHNDQIMFLEPAYSSIRRSQFIPLKKEILLTINNINECSYDEKYQTITVKTPEMDIFFIIYQEKLSKYFYSEKELVVGFTIASIAIMPKDIDGNYIKKFLNTTSDKNQRKASNVIYMIPCHDLLSEILIDQQSQNLSDIKQIMVRFSNTDNRLGLALKILAPTTIPGYIPMSEGEINYHYNQNVPMCWVTMLYTLYKSYDEMITISEVFSSHNQKTIELFKLTSNYSEFCEFQIESRLKATIAIINITMTIFSVIYHMDQTFDYNVMQWIQNNINNLIKVPNANDKLVQTTLANLILENMKSFRLSIIPMHEIASRITANLKGNIKNIDNILLKSLVGNVKIIEDILERWRNGYAILNNLPKIVAHVILSYSWQYSSIMDIDGLFKINQIELHLLNLLKEIKISGARAIYESANGLISYDEALILNIIFIEKEAFNYILPLIKPNN